MYSNKEKGSLGESVTEKLPSEFAQNYLSNLTRSPILEKTAAWKASESVSLILPLPSPAVADFVQKIVGKQQVLPKWAKK